MFWYLLETHIVMIIFLNSANNSLVYPVFSSSVADKSFEDKDSVDGGLSSSSSSSKAPPGGRRTVVTSVRRPSSANTAKTTGEKRRASAVHEIILILTLSTFFFSKVKKLALAPLMRRISSKPLKTCPQSK